MSILEDARKCAVSEIEKYGSPPLGLFEISEKKALELAKKFEIDKDVVILGVYLMDLKLGQAIKEGRVKDHVNMSVEAAKEFLDKYDLDKEKKDKIINCIAAHHNDVKYACLEAEICANADCYRFLEPKGILIFMHVLSNERQMEFKEVLQATEAKMDEKYNILSLDICKKELEEKYRSFKKILAEFK